MKFIYTAWSALVTSVGASTTLRGTYVGGYGNDKNAPGNSRIVGGDDAGIGEYPFFVEWDGCGAALVHNDIIISAAHCADIVSNTVYVGSSRQFGIGIDGGRGYKRTITERRPHPLFDSSPEAGFEYDYLVMKLRASVDNKPALLNESNESPADGQTLTVVGYGDTSEGGSGSFILQEVEVGYIPTETCKSIYPDINSDIMMCAGVGGGGKDSCQGDSGGPLVIADGENFTLVGIVSSGIGCARPDTPGVYSRVSGEIDWIKGQICELSSNPPEYCAGMSPATVSPVASISPVASFPSSNAPTFAIMPSPAPTAASWTRTPTTFSIAPTPNAVTPSSAPASTITPSPAPTAASPTRTPTTSSAAPTPNAVTPSSAPASTITPSPAPTAALPTRTPTTSSVAPSPNACADSNDDTLLIDEIIGRKDCAWLSENPLFGYLCKFIDVAAACKKTCNACDYFYPATQGH